MTAVRSLGKRTAARKAERGAMSMDWVQARRMRNRRDSGREEGIGMRARKMDEGRWVKTIVWTAIGVSIPLTLRELVEYSSIP
jgi:hypothetical protein